jgi:ribosomal protein S18 acetylase RimI-like enzyme
MALGDQPPADPELRRHDSSPPQLALRPATADDREFLAELYASTREEELLAVDWSADAKRGFLRQQFEAQDLHYRAHYPGAAFDVIAVGEQAIGRLYLYRSVREIRLMDISLLPAWRNRGLGTQLVREVLAEAQRQGQLVTLHVEPWNPAKRLYQRLGFRFVELRGAYEFLEASPYS